MILKEATVYYKDFFVEQEKNKIKNFYLAKVLICQTLNGTHGTLLCIHLLSG